MRGKVSRVILVCTILIALSYAWWPFQKDDEKPKKRRGRGGRDRDEESDRVEQEWEVESDDRYEPEKGRGVSGSRDRDKQERERNRRAAIKSPSEKARAADRASRKKPRNREEMESKAAMKDALADEDVAETETFEDDGYLSDDEIHRLWTEHMHDFVPEDMMNTVIEKNSVEALYENISHTTPTTIKGAYYVYGGSKEKGISCVVYDPDRNILYKRKGSPQGILVFETTVPGEYSVVFSNFQSGQDLIVTLALHTYEEDKEQHDEYDLTDDGERIMRGQKDNAFTGDGEEQIETRSAEDMVADDEDVGNVRQMLRDIQVKSKQIQSEAKLSLMRQSGHNEDLLTNASWNFYVALLELCAFAGILFFQTHHIKKCLDNKLIL